MTKFKPNHLLTQKALKALLHFDPNSGIFTWISARPRIHVGMVAGCLMPEGYIRITVDGHRVMAHQLAWLYMTGDYIVRGIDHKDTNRANNKWINLRRATRSQNNMNAGLRSDNSTGFKGVSIKRGKSSKRYCAQIGLTGHPNHIGYFRTAEEAHAAYMDKARELYGDYARAA